MKKGEEYYTLVSLPAIGYAKQKLTIPAGSAVTVERGIGWDLGIVRDSAGITAVANSETDLEPMVMMREATGQLSLFAGEE
jgi:hypothetical protein